MVQVLESVRARELPVVTYGDTVLSDYLHLGLGLRDLCARPTVWGLLKFFSFSRVSTRVQVIVDVCVCGLITTVFDKKKQKKKRDSTKASWLDGVLSIKK